MRFAFLAGFLLGLTATLHAQQPATLDSLLPSYTRARFWTPGPSHPGWHDGWIIRVFPSSGAPCVGVFSEQFSGFDWLADIDSLVVQPGSAPEVQLEVRAGGALGVPNPGLPWRTLDVRELRTREKGCDAASIH
jgi:hypothetical protein